MEGDRVANGAKAAKIESNDVCGPRFLSIRAGRKVKSECYILKHTIFLFRHQVIYSDVDIDMVGNHVLRNISN